MSRSSRTTLGPALRRELLRTVRHQAVRRAGGVIPLIGLYRRYGTVRHVVRALRRR
ncbi:hypothetical protein [Kocuria tytonis]|uniref:hypothetical protein n=1 Tax=Kocuria tytonis TaxID=2054280 RepID=UPI0018F39ABB|nr:hypothetical protein [Kocuria tytonis]